MTKSTPVRGARAAALGAFTLVTGVLVAAPLVLSTAGVAHAALPDCSTVAGTSISVTPSTTTGDASTSNFRLTITPGAACTLGTSGVVGLADDDGDALLIDQENTYTQTPTDLAAGVPFAFLDVAWFNLLCSDVILPIHVGFAFGTGTVANAGTATPPTCVSEGSGGLGSRLLLLPVKGDAQSPPPVVTTTTASVAPSSASRTSTPSTSTTTTASVSASSVTRTSGPAGTLPFTGSSSVGPLLAAGEATVLAGGVMALVLRKRKRA